jgi:hypothetical protein
VSDGYARLGQTGLNVPAARIGMHELYADLEPGYAEQPADRQFGRRETTIPPTFQQRLGTS